MANRILIIFLAVICIVHYGAAALSCYFCTNNFGTNCITPNKTTTRCRLHNEGLNHQLTQLYGLEFVSAPVKSFENIRCLHYERFLLSENRTEMYRGCLHLKYAEDYCQNQQLNHQYYPYNVTKCNVCDKDYCNSSKNLRSNAQIAGIVILCGLLLFSV